MLCQFESNTFYKLVFSLVQDFDQQKVIRKHYTKEQKRCPVYFSKKSNFLVPPGFFSTLSILLKGKNFLQTNIIYSVKLIFNFQCSQGGKSAKVMRKLVRGREKVDNNQQRKKHAKAYHSQVTQIVGNNHMSWLFFSTSVNEFFPNFFNMPNFLALHIFFN